MYYFLCEGAKEKSEYKFISAIISEFKTSDKQYILESAQGNRGIERTFMKMKSAFKTGDTFILFFDCVETIANVPVFDLLSNISDLCSLLGVRFRYTTYYCFEELFLSYPCILDIVNVSEEVLSELKNVQSMLLNSHNYFKEDLSFWRSYFVNQPGVFKSREHLSAGICSCVLKTAKGHFSLTKDNIGSCWVSDCSMTSLHERICESCKYLLKGCTFREKLSSIDTTSVAKFSLPFSTIFD